MKKRPRENGRRQESRFKSLWLICGLALVLGALVLLFYNESRSVTRYHRLMEDGVDELVPLGGGSHDPENNGKLVHVQGLAKPAASVSDPVFGVSARVIKLRRNVKMYQWEESPASDKGGLPETACSYTPVWSERRIPSEGFSNDGYRNPEKMPWTEQTFVAPRVKVGELDLSPKLIGQINLFRPLPVEGPPPPNLPGLPKKPIQAVGGEYYIGQTPQIPAIGDIRVGFEQVRPTNVSIVARQQGKTLYPVVLPGKRVDALKLGFHTADSMLRFPHEQSAFAIWGLRLLGFSLAFLGLVMLFRGLAVLEQGLPLLGELAHRGDSVVAFLIALALGFVAISLSWMPARPVLSWALLLVAAAFFAGIKILPSQQESQTASEKED